MSARGCLQRDGGRSAPPWEPRGAVPVLRVLQLQWVRAAKPLDSRAMAAFQHPPSASLGSRAGGTGACGNCHFFPFHVARCSLPSPAPFINGSTRDDPSRFPRGGGFPGVPWPRAKPAQPINGVALGVADLDTASFLEAFHVWVCFVSLSFLSLNPSSLFQPVS
jgi:hypothetical protein